LACQSIPGWSRTVVSFFFGGRWELIELLYDIMKDKLFLSVDFLSFWWFTVSVTYKELGSLALRYLLPFPKTYVSFGSQYWQQSIIWTLLPIFMWVAVSDIVPPCTKTSSASIELSTYSYTSSLII
jgi:hypothetical protein